MNELAAGKYGDNCWGVGIHRGKVTEVVILLADECRVENGVLILTGHSGSHRENIITLATFAPGAWSHCFAASALDGTPIAALDWAGGLK